MFLVNELWQINHWERKGSVVSFWNIHVLIGEPSLGQSLDRLRYLETELWINFVYMSYNTSWDVPQKIQHVGGVSQETSLKISWLACCFCCFNVWVSSFFLQTTWIGEQTLPTPWWWHFLGYKKDTNSFHQWRKIYEQKDQRRTKSIFMETRWPWMPCKVAS